MKKQKTKKIAVKVTTQMIVVLVVVFIALITIITNVITRDLIAREQEKLTLLATENARIAREFMESMLNKQEVIGNTVLSLQGTGDDQKINTMNKVIEATNEKEDNILGLFFIAEPNTFVSNSPNGYSILSTKSGTTSEKNMFKNLSQQMYEGVKTSQKMSIGDPTNHEIHGKTYNALTVLLPVTNANNEFIGLVGSYIDTSVLNGADYNTGGYSTFFTHIICGHKTVITDSKKPENIGQGYESVSDSENPQEILDAANNTDPTVMIDKGVDGKRYYKSYVPFYIQGSSVVWLSGTGIQKTEFDSQIFKQIIFIALSTIVGLVILCIIIYVRINKNLKPIRLLEESVIELSKGNLNHELTFESKDELGSLADNLRKSTGILSSYIQDIDRAMGELARGNFDVMPTQSFIGDFKAIENSIIGLVVNMSDTFRQMAMAADQVNGGADQVSSGAQALAQGATQQASSVEELAATITEISTNVQENAKNAQSAENMANDATTAISASNVHMQDLMTAMTDINSQSVEISKIIKTIEDIAFQTNILALNAAVEAARAGTAGKGFAVVADEVRNLAGKSSEAAKNITSLINESVESISVGVNLAQNTAEEMVTVVEGAKATTEVITRISHATAEQAAALTQVSLGVEQISAVVQTNSATSQESAAASEELSSQSHLMKNLISRFTLLNKDRLK